MEFYKRRYFHLTDHSVLINHNTQSKTGGDLGQLSTDWLVGSAHASSRPDLCPLLIRTATINRHSGAEYGRFSEFPPIICCFRRVYVEHVGWSRGSFCFDESSSCWLNVSTQSQERKSNLQQHVEGSDGAQLVEIYQRRRECSQETSICEKMGKTQNE